MCKLDQHEFNLRYEADLSCAEFIIFEVLSIPGSGGGVCAYPSSLHTLLQIVNFRTSSPFLGPKIRS